MSLWGTLNTQTILPIRSQPPEYWQHSSEAYETGCACQTGIPPLAYTRGYTSKPMLASRFLHSLLTSTCYEYQSPHVSLVALLTPSTILGSRLFQIPSPYVQLPGSLYNGKLPSPNLLVSFHSSLCFLTMANLPLLSASLKGSHGCFELPQISLAILSLIFTINLFFQIHLWST